jgi:serine/threonine protein kinase
MIEQYSIGGSALASGGFGCVFSPSLKCEGKKRDKNKISKLMIEKYAYKEYDEIKLIRLKLKTIKNYEDFFLINDIQLCKPAKLTEEDLKNYNKKCTALPKNKITKKNINRSLNKLMTLNIPNGGIPVDDYIYKKGSFYDLLQINVSLINLLQNGIIKMNNKNVYHCDIKDANVLVKHNGLRLQTRLIDWGLSTEYTPFKNEPFPKTWRNRPLQFNSPFSVIIFTDYFVEKYTKYIQNGGTLTKENLKPFVIDYIYFWIKKRGAGHYKFINEIMYILFSNDLKNIDDNVKKQIIENEFTLSYITNYIVEILINFTFFKKDGSLNLRSYLDNVFIKIVDITGFIVTYFSMLEILFNNYANLNVTQQNIFNLLKSIFVNYLYTPRIEPINVDELVNEFQKLNYLFEIELNLERQIERNANNNLNTHFSHKSSKLVFKKSTKTNIKKHKLIMLSGINKKTIKNKIY